MTKEEAIKHLTNAKVRLEGGCKVAELHEATRIAIECILESIEADEKWIKENVKAC